MGIKITIKNEDNNTEKEFSLGMSEKAKRNLKIFGKATGKAVNSSAEKIGSFIEELVANEGEGVLDVAENIIAMAKEKIFSEEELSDEEKQRLAKIALEKKIKQIPEGKLFTLEEYLKYTDEFDWGSAIKYTDEELVQEFLNIIRYPYSPVSREAFEKSIGMEKISYINLAKNIKTLEILYPDQMVDEDFIIETLKNNFDRWLNERPDIGKYCTDASLMKLIRYFVENVHKVQTEFFDEEEEDTEDIQLQNEFFKIPQDKTMTLSEYFGYMEGYLFDKPNANSYEKAMDFLNKINYPITEASICTFASAIFLSKNMSYKDIVSKFIVPGKSEEEKVEMLKNDFNTWLERRPDIKKQCTNANLRQLLIYYKKKAIENVSKN